MQSSLGEAMCMKLFQGELETDTCTVLDFCFNVELIRQTQIRQDGKCWSGYEDSGTEKKQKTASAFILSEVSVHLNKHRMISWAEEQGCLKDK